MQRSPTPPVATARTPEPAKAGVASSQIEPTTLASSTPSNNLAGILLLAGFALGTLLLTIAIVVPASAARFTLPGGRAVFEHHVDMALLGIALAVLTGLVYVLETAGQ